MNRLVRMVLRLVVNRGINMGVDAMARRNKTDADPVARKQAAETSKRTRQSLRMMRRFFRF